MTSRRIAAAKVNHSPCELARFFSKLLEEEHRKKIGHAGPILFCYCHAIELYLKALLRLVHSVAALSTKFGHDFERLLTEAERTRPRSCC
jgi:hypothetical protein